MLVEVSDSRRERADAFQALTGAENRFIWIVKDRVEVPELDQLLVVDAKQPTVEEDIDGVYRPRAIVVAVCSIKCAEVTMTRHEICGAWKEPGPFNVVQSADCRLDLCGR